LQDGVEDIRIANVANKIQVVGFTGADEKDHSRIGVKGREGNNLAATLGRHEQEFALP
jgi:hypothetical protein